MLHVAVISGLLRLLIQLAGLERVCLDFGSCLVANLLLQGLDFLVQLHDVHVHLLEILLLVWSHGCHGL